MDPRMAQMMAAQQQQQGRAPVVVLNTAQKRETGIEAQLGNIQAAKAVADIIRTCLGPMAMLKMLINPMGGIVLTNDGNAILREVDVNHPAAKSMIELSRVQDEEVGDGTTSVIILAGELLSVLGTLCGRFQIRKIGDEYFSFIVAKPDADVHACTVLLRGASRDVLNEVERNMQDAMCVARNIMRESRLVPGGGAVEMALSQALTKRAKSVEGVQQWPYKAVALALEVIPRTLAQNCGANAVRKITKLRAKHAMDPEKFRTWGIDGETGELVDAEQLGVWEPLSVKAQTLKTAFEAAAMLLRVDAILSGGSGNAGGAPGGGQPTAAQMQDGPPV